MANSPGPNSHPHHKTGDLAVIWIPADPDIDIELKVVADDWRSMASLVGGGYIEPVHGLKFEDKLVMDCGCPLALVVNEEGLLKHLRFNARAAHFYRGEVIVGDAFLVGEGPVAGPDGVDRDFISLQASGTPLVKTVVDLVRA